MKTRTTEEIVKNVPEPKFTKSWHPVSHAKVIDALELAVNKTGMEVVDRHYSLQRNGLNVFGTWHLSQEFNGGSWMLGFRNSMCKEFAIGICAGTNIMVCSNMVFSGNFVEFRRHTSGVDPEELRFLSVRGVESITKDLERFADWQLNLKEYPLDREEFKVMTFDALEKQIIPPTKFHKFVECHDKEAALNDAPSLYTFHGGVTRLMRESSLFTISHYSNKLEGFCDDYIVQKAA